MTIVCVTDRRMSRKLVSKIRIFNMHFTEPITNRG
jgi:hypothetical protein